MKADAGCGIDCRRCNNSIETDELNWYNIFGTVGMEVTWYDR